MSQPTPANGTHANGTTKERAFHKTNILPPLDVYENADELLVVIDVPGISAGDLSIEVLGDSLKFTAEARTPGAPGAPVERVFERVIRLPANIDAERITAETKNGTVVLHMPKLEAAKPRKIPVKSA